MSPAAGRFRYLAAVAKRADSVYQLGLRTDLWSKHHISMGQEFVVGEYTPSANGFDALVVGFYRGKDLIYAGRVRAGFVPATRKEVFVKIKHLKTDKCPFSNLPEKATGDDKDPRKIIKET